MSFAYEAYDRAGKQLKGDVDASSLDHARDILSARGLFVTKVWQGRAGGAKSAGTRSARRPVLTTQVNLPELAATARQLSILVATGTPIADALRAAEIQSKQPDTKAALKSVRRAVEEGASTADAMSQQPKLFDPVTCSLVEAGEASGALDQMLSRIAAITRQSLTTRRAVRSAMTYPTVLLSIAAIILGVMMIFVTPRFGGMFEALNAPLPATTEGLLAISAFVRSYWWAVGPILLLCAIGLFVALRTNQGADWMGRVMLSVPGVGGVMRSLYSARLARVLGVLLEARVPLVEALDLTEASMGHAAYRDLLAKAQADLVDGESFTSSISRTTLLTPAIIEAIRNGEATARLGSVLTTTAEHLDEDNAQAMRSLSTVIEPLVIVLMGIVIGFVALSMFLPLFDLTSMAGSGGVR